MAPAFLDSFLDVQYLFISFNFTRNLICMQSIIENNFFFNRMSLVDFFVQLIASSHLKVYHLIKALESICCLRKMAKVHVSDAVQITVLIVWAVNFVQNTNSCRLFKIKLKVIQSLVKANCSVLDFGSVVFIFVFFSLYLVEDFFHHSRLSWRILRIGFSHLDQFLWSKWLKWFVDEFTITLTLLIYYNIWLTKNLSIHMQFVFERIYSFLILTWLILNYFVEPILQALI